MAKKKSARKSTRAKKPKSSKKSTTKKAAAPKAESKGTLSIEPEQPSGIKTWHMVGVGLVIVLLLVLHFGTGVSPVVDPMAESDPNVVQVGDRVHIKFTAMGEDGTVYDTNYAHIAEELGFDLQSDTLSFVVGEDTALMGVDKGVRGMSVGEKATLTLSPEEAYGERDEDFIITWPSFVERKLRVTIQRVFAVKKSDLKEIFSEDLVELAFKEGEILASEAHGIDYEVLHVGTDAVQLKIQVAEDQELQLPDLPWPAKVWWFDEDVIIAHQQPEIGDTIKLQWGIYEVTGWEPPTYTLTTTIEEGERVYGNGKYGTVTSVTNETVTFDANHPLAGKTLIFDVEVVSIARS